MTEFEIHDLDDIEPEDLIDLFVSVGWGRIDNYRPGVMTTLLEMSDFHAGARYGGKLVGFVRVLSDRVMTTWIAELLVNPEYQQKGIGSALVERVTSEFNHTAIYAMAFVGTEGFFEKFGLKRRANKLVAVSRRPLSG